ncbi:hypothetical protein AURDEDRAFT_113839 [Auricularia subglabra TFB-10046 SS5]|nr:hypothetical protein AURDEDRAFT_113839 [Auricularia subglabra TFB-10046 SS5]
MHMPGGGGGRMRGLQEGIVTMFAGGFRHMANLTVLSLPNKLNEAYAALMDLHFPLLERLEVKCDVPAVDFIARHAETLTHLVYPHHLVDACELPHFPRLTHLHGAPDMLRHVLQHPRSLRYLGVVTSPALEPAGKARVEDDSVNCLGDILSACGEPHGVFIRDPFGFDNIAHAVSDLPPLASVTRLELISYVSDEKLVPGLSTVARVFPNVRNLRLASAVPSKALFAHPPHAMCEVLLCHWPHLEVVVADFHYFSRGVRDRDKFKYDHRRLEMPKPWALVTGP